MIDQQPQIELRARELRGRQRVDLVQPRLPSAGLPYFPVTAVPYLLTAFRPRCSSG